MKLEDLVSVTLIKDVERMYKLEWLESAETGRKLKTSTQLILGNHNKQIWLLTYSWVEE